MAGFPQTINGTLYTQAMFDGTGYVTAFPAIFADLAAVAAGIAAAAAAGGTFVGQVAINNATASTSTTTGALVVQGGVGIGGDLFFGGAAGASWTPTVTSGSGTITTVGTVTARYKKLGRLVYFAVDIAITTNGTGAGTLNFTLPFAHSGVGPRAAFVGRENGVSGAMIYGFAALASDVVAVRTSAGAYPAADGARIFVSGMYEASS